MIKLLILLMLLTIVPDVAISADSSPIATDSRIRTYVYGENEVFGVRTRFGYQSNIEFGDDEEISTMSIGDSVSWKVTPSGNRLFVKAMEEDRATNLTVVTNKRAYQFDLSSQNEAGDDVVYVVRFFYPEKDFDARKRRPKSNDFKSGALIDAAYNFNYSLTGAREIAPVQVFDDGRFTFFKFSGSNAVVPNFSMVDERGTEIPLVTRDDGQYIVVERVYKQFSLRRGDGVVCVFNDSAVGGGPKIR